MLTSLYRPLLILLWVWLSGWMMAGEKPNLLFILSDDHRPDELSCAGNTILKTPHLDTLAASGTRFKNAFVTTSICAASRASILTGLVERSHGHTFGKPPISRKHMETSYPAVLRKHGYYTGFYGKWGVRAEGNAGKSLFDQFEYLRAPYFKKQPDGSVRHVDEIIGDRAVAFLEKRPKDRPFCLSLSFNIAHADDGNRRPGAGHFPWPRVVNGLYQDTVFPKPRLSDSAVFEAHPEFLRKSMNRARYYWRWDTPEKYQENMRGRYRMITGMDRIIGRVLGALEKQGLREKTVVIFMGDNGYYRGQRGFAGKWSHYGESLRVPLIICDPRAKEKGRVETDIALNIDVAPTLIAAAGVKGSPNYQGKPLMLSNNDDKREYFFCEHQMEHKAIPKWEGVRSLRYAYARYTQHDPAYEFLHDLKTDPDQLRNLAADPAYQNILQQLRKLTDDKIRHARSRR